MSKKIIIDANFPNETRVVLLSSNNNVEDIEYENISKKQLKGNIYLAKVTRVEASLQAVFLDYGADKGGFLPFNEINPDYYNIPVSDKESLIKQSLQPISPPTITEEDFSDSSNQLKHYSFADKEDIDIQEITKLVDEKIELDFELEVADNEIETIKEKTFEAQKIQNQYKIQEVIKKGQILLVQVVKEGRGNKGASFTTYISLAGKYCVLMPNRPFNNGVSKKISNAEERKRLKNIISKLVSENDNKAASIIVRTAGIGRNSVEIKKDYDYLIRAWNKIRDVTLKSSAPCFIHEEEGIIQKTIRDMFDHGIKEIIVQGNNAYQDAVRFMRDIMPEEIKKVKEYKNKTPIFTQFNIENQLSNLYKPVVSLYSGGYIVINPTEALVSIDVNSGKSNLEKNIEETALRNNLEAAKEIARQIRLRDLSGLLVVDFIDMYESRNKKIVERSFKEFLSRDKARIQTSSISAFGLLEMSRQRMRPSFLEFNSVMCHHCNGKGLIRADESNSMLILRTIENEIYNSSFKIINVYAHSNAVLYLLNYKRIEVYQIENKYNIKVNFYIDCNATSDVFSIEKVSANNQNHSITTLKPAVDIHDEIQQENNANISKNNKKKWNNATINSGEINNDIGISDSEQINDVNIVAENQEKKTQDHTFVRKRSVRKRGNAKKNKLNTVKTKDNLLESS